MKTYACKMTSPTYASTPCNEEGPGHLPITPTRIITRSCDCPDGNRWAKDLSETGTPTNLPPSYQQGQ